MNKFMQVLVNLIAASLLSSSRAAVATAIPGQTATLSVTADGSAPFGYQWYKDETILPGANDPVYVISEINSSHAGDYNVKVYNEAGQTTSDVATLQVIEAGVYDTSFSQARAENITCSPFVWTPVVGSAISDIGAHLDPSTGFYVVKPGEGGTYQIIIRVRPEDMAPENISYGIAAWRSNQDSETTLWCSTNTHGPAWMRNGAMNIIEQYFADGDQIRVLLYSQATLKFYFVTSTIKRL